MINLRTFFKVHFHTAEISDANFYKFVEDHLARLAANNDDGKYSLLLNDTQTAFNGYAAAINKEDTQYSQQQGSTIDVDTVIAEFKEQVSRSEGLINYKYGIKSAAYQEFFPMGLKEYSQATKSNIETLMARMANKSQKYASELEVAFVTRFSEFPLRYAELRRKQLENIGRVSADKSKTDELRAILEKQVMLNVLEIAKEFLGNTERGMDFFDQSIIRRNIYSTDEGEYLKGNVNANANKTILKDFDENANFVLTNSGVGALRFWTSHTDNDQNSQQGITISSGDTITATVYELNPEGGDKLHVYNLDSEKTGEYYVERLV